MEVQDVVSYLYLNSSCSGVKILNTLFLITFPAALVLAALIKAIFVLVSRENLFVALDGFSPEYISCRDSSASNSEAEEPLDIYDITSSPCRILNVNYRIIYLISCFSGFLGMFGI